MSRIQLLGVWLLCLLACPITLTILLIDALIGSTDDALQIAISEDEAGNSVFGGPATQTISTRVGNALVRGEPWAHFVAPIIDAMFGKGHCLANATVKA